MARPILVATLLLAACSSSGPGPDAARDLVATADRGDLGPRPDGTTPCGSKTCNAATEICVAVGVRLSSGIGCQAPPAGCEPLSQRTCACAAAICKESINAPFTRCVDNATNSIFCTCPPDYPGGCK
jgi:hypothetical protein